MSPNAFPMRLYFRLVTAVLLSAVISCDEATAPRVPTAVSVVNDNQTGAAGETLPKPIIITVRDAAGGTIAGAELEFAVVEGGGILSEAAKASGGDGRLSLQWALGTVAAENQAFEIRAAATDQVLARVTADAVAGPPVEIVAETPAQTAVVTQPLPLPLVARVLDVYGNPVAGVPVGWSSDDFMLQEPLLALTDGEGHTRNVWQGTTKAGVLYARVVVCALVSCQFGSALPPAVFQVTFSPMPPAVVTKVAGDHQTATTGSAVPTTPAVKVTDQFANVIVGATVDFAVTAGGGTVAAATATTNDNGIAISPIWTLGPTAGTNTLTATVANVGPVTFNATAVAPTPNAPRQHQ